MKYPLQKELEKDLQESTELLGDLYKGSYTKQSENLARKYYNAIKRIVAICENRKRY